MIDSGSTPPDAPTLLLFIILFIHSITHHKEVRAVRNRFEFIIVTGTQECDRCRCEAMMLKPYFNIINRPTEFFYIDSSGANGEVAQLVE